MSIQKNQYFLFFLVLIAIIPITGAEEMATVHGAIYEWDTFEPLENVIVEVNSTPPQSMVARYGIYSFNLAPGNYVISASYYQNSTLIHYTEEEITITNDGDYVIDIIFLPTYYEEEELNGTEFDELDELADLAENDGQDNNILSSTLIYVLAALAMTVAGAYVLSRRKTDGNGGNAHEGSGHLENSDLAAFSDELADLPDDLREVVDIIAGNGGRIKQKDLRDRLRHSEAKVSLMVSDLENRGIIRKFKKGRGNVIILEGSDHTNQNV